jgi:hypothetical protein
VVTYQPIVAAVTVTRHPRFNPHAVRQGVSPARASASRPVRLRPVSITVDAVRRTPCATVSRTVRPALTMGRQPVLSVDENAILVEGDALVGQLPFPALDLSGQLLHRALADRKRAVDAA